MARASAGFTNLEAPEEVSTSSAIPFEQLKFDEVELGDLGNSLPVGVFTPDGDRLQEFTLLPYSGNHEIALGKLIEANTGREGTMKEPMKVLREFLPHVIETIGGIPLKEVAQKFSTSPARFFEGMYLGDVTTLLLQVRLQAQGYEIAMAAECPKCGTVAKDDPDKGRPYSDLSSLKIKTIPFLPQKPVFEVTLPESFLVYGEPVTKLWLEPLKLNQLDKLLKSMSGKPKDLDQLQEMVVGLPESEAFRNNKGRFFDESLYSALCMGADGRVSPNKNALYRAIGKIVPGPKMEVPMDCINPQCRNHWEQSLPWISFREFLYFTASATDDD